MSLAAARKPSTGACQVCKPCSAGAAGAHAATMKASETCLGLHAVWSVPITQPLTGTAPLSLRVAMHVP